MEGSLPAFPRMTGVEANKSQALEKSFRAYEAAPKLKDANLILFGQHRWPLNRWNWMTGFDGQFYLYVTKMVCLRCNGFL